MNSLAEKLSVKQAPVYQGEPVKAEKAGRVQWAVVDGARVNGGYQSVGETLSAYGSSIIAIGKHDVGTLVYVARDGEPVLAGQIVAYVKPLQAPSKPTTRAATNHTAPNGKTPQCATGEASTPAEEPAPLPVVREEPAFVVSAHNGDGRRSTLGNHETPEVEELAIERPAKKQKRERTKHHTTHLTPSQIRRVKKTALRLDLEDVVPGCAEAELIRAAIEMLLDLPEPALLAMIEKNRERERAGGYGSGFKRGPGKR